MDQSKSQQTKLSAQIPSSRFQLMLSEFLSVLIPLLLFVVVLIIPLPIGLLNASRYNYWLFGSAIAILFT